MGLKAIVFYHPKNPRNVDDVASIASSLGARLIVVMRPGEQLEVSQPNVEFVGSISEALERLRIGSDARIIVLETYGEPITSDVGSICGLAPSRDIVVVIGAEDYGVPVNIVESLKDRFTVCVLSLPSAVTGHSYNVVSALVMAIYELGRTGILSR